MSLTYAPHTEAKWRSAMRWHEDVVVAGAGHCWCCCCCSHSWCHMSGVVEPGHDDEEL